LNIFMNKLQLVVIMVFLNTVSGQIIVNTEKLANQAGKGLNAGLEFNFDYEQGNSDVIEFNGKALVGTGNDKQSIKLLTGLRYLSEDNNELIYRNFIHLRHNYNFTTSVRSFSFYQLQRNNSLLLKRRQLFGAGIRKVIQFADSLKIDVGSGLIYEMEKLNSPDTINNEKASQSCYRMANIMSIVYQLKSYMFMVDAVYFQPDINNFKDFRFFNELSFTFVITKYLNFNVSTVWRHDSRPPLNLKRNDINIETGIVVRFNSHDKDKD
jgi:hypothetical protein